MPLYRYKNRILLFVHIPKTGGSSVEKFFKSGPAVQAFHSRQRLGMNSVTPQHMHWEVIEKWIPANFYDAAFCVVRNPFSRVASEYRWQRQARQAAVRGFDVWINNKLDIFEKNPYICDNHIRPQVEFVGGAVKVFHLENGISHAINFGNITLGLSSNLPELTHVAATQKELLKVRIETLERLSEFYKMDFQSFGYRSSEIPDGLFEIVGETSSKMNWS